MTKETIVDLKVKRININLIYTLDAVLHSSSLTNAGYLIGLSQPAMSLSLRKLRDLFDDDIVVYGGARMRRTELGEALAPRARQLIRQSHDLFALDLDFDPGKARRVITLTAPQPIEIVLLSKVAQALLRQGEELSVRLTTLKAATSLEAFASGVDLAIVPGSMLDPAFCHIPLLEQRLSCLVCRQHPTIEDAIDVGAYDNGRHAAVSSDIERAAALMDLEHPLMERRRIVATTENISTLPGLIAGTDLIVTMADWLAQHLAWSQPLKVVSAPMTGSTTMYAQWEACRDREPFIGWLKEQVLAEVATLTAHLPGK